MRRVFLLLQYAYTSMALVQNKKAYFDYEILEEIEAGIKLLGFEVKSLKKGQGSLAGAYVIIRGDEAFLVGAHVPPYQPGNTPKDYDPLRPRKLLLNKKEIVTLAEFEKQRGLTMMPLSMYNKNGKIKVSVGIGRGKKKYDKRETIRRRDIEREIGRTLKG